MQTEISITDGSSKPVNRDKIKYQTDIIATRCTWRESLEVEYTLQNTPETGQKYTITLHQPVKFSLNMHLWLFYDCPLAFYNGYEKEEEIEAARFCFGEITQVIYYDNSTANIEFTVKEILSFSDILKTKTLEDLPQFWADFYTGFIKRNDFSLEKFGKYYTFNVSAQSDLGQKCVIRKQWKEYVICFLNEWCFAENATYGGKYRVPENIKNLIKKRKKGKNTEGVKLI